MKSKKKNEMEKVQNTMGAAQELDMDALEDVSGGYVVEDNGYFKGYRVIGGNSKLSKLFFTREDAEAYNQAMGYAASAEEALAKNRRLRFR